ncbi:MAG: hypothetical protein JXD23_08665 [Spirochaetales bacterium]|nr:hypothetical protein [Spirochaetales bacterium]
MAEENLPRMRRVIGVPRKRDEVVRCRRGRRHRRTPVRTHLRLTGKIRGSMVKVVTRRSRFR